MLQAILTALGLSLSTPPGTQAVSLPEPGPVFVNSEAPATRAPLEHATRPKRTARTLAALTR
jgi:hypothetical protein